MRQGKGWHRESQRHSLARRGIKTAQKVSPILTKTIKRKKSKEQTLIDDYNRTKNRNVLQNKGLAQEYILFSRKNKKIGTMKDYRGINVPIKLDIEIKETDLSTQAIYNGEGELLRIGSKKRTTDNKQISSYKNLSISGNIGQEQGGQIQDTLRKGLNDPDFDFNNKKAVKELLDIWDEYHLNDLNAGTKKQEQALKRWKQRPTGDSYSEDVEYLKSKKLYNDRGYKYGTAWLVDDLPKDIISKLDSIMKKL